MQIIVTSQASRCASTPTGPIVVMEPAGPVYETYVIRPTRRGRYPYSRWLRVAIKDDELASATAEVERAAELGPAETHRRIRRESEQRCVLED
jgi:hypothetical protein